MIYIIYILAGLGAGIVTGLAGLSAAVIITPMLVSLCGWKSYDAVNVALASDVLASLLSAYTYYKNKNIDLKRGIYVTITAFLGTIIGSYCGYLFSRSNPDGLGYISMATTVLLGVKFLCRPVTGGMDKAAAKKIDNKTRKAMLFGAMIGWVCGFTGSGGGVLMLMVFTLILGYNLKIAVGTSTMIMSLVALTGSISHLCMGAEIFPVPMAVVMAACLLGVLVSARFANKCEIKKLNRIVGVVLLILGIATLVIKLV